MKTLFTLFLSFLFGAAGIAQSNSIPAGHLELVAQHLRNQKGLSGYFVLGAGNGIVYQQGFGFADRANQIPFSEKTLYTIGSITKPFTATAILLLRERGQLDVQDPVSKYFPNVPADKKGITLHQLLTHSSGLPGAMGDDYAAITDEEFQKMAWSQNLQFAPGEGYAYSNVGYSLLGMIVEKITRGSYSAFLAKNIFEPAGMKTAGYSNPGVDYGRLAHGYAPEGADWGTSRDKLWNGDEPYWHLKANGGILVSSMDMYQWYLALKNNTILKPESLKLQTSPHVREGENAESFYGYGYAVTPDGESVQHNGGNRIFKADFRWFPKSDFFLFSATNDANVRLFHLNDQIIDILHTGKLPVTLDWQPIPMDLFPSGVDQTTASKFIALLQAYSSSAGNTFIDEYFSPGIIERNGRERLLEILQTLGQDISTLPVKQVNQADGWLQVIVPSQFPGDVLKIRLAFAQGKIERLGAEIEGS